MTKHRAGELIPNDLRNPLNNLMYYTKGTQHLTKGGPSDAFEAGAKATALKVSGSARDMGENATRRS